MKSVYCPLGPTVPCNVLGVVMETKHHKYKLCTEQRVLFGYFSFYHIFKAPRTPTLSIKNITDGEPKSRGKQLTVIFLN